MFNNRVRDCIKMLEPHVDLSKLLRLVDLGKGLAANPVLNTFTTRVATIVPGFGSPTGGDTNFLNANVALSGTVQQTKTLPSTGTWAAPNTISRGWVRVKIYGGSGTSPTVTDLVVEGGDGTNTVLLGVFHPNAAWAISATSTLDLLFPFITDLTLTSISVLSTLGGTGPGATMDLEVGGTAGTAPTSS